MPNNEIVFYFGIAIIILFFGFFVYFTIKNDEISITDEIDLNEHKKFIIISILLLIGAIIVWRIVFLIFYDSINFYYKEIKSIFQIQKMLNG